MGVGAVLGTSLDQIRRTVFVQQLGHRLWFMSQQARTAGILAIMPILYAAMWSAVGLFYNDNEGFVFETFFNKSFFVLAATLEYQLTFLCIYFGQPGSPLGYLASHPAVWCCMMWQFAVVLIWLLCF